jgi:hypothetical protein
METIAAMQRISVFAASASAELERHFGVLELVQGTLVAH